MNISKFVSITTIISGVLLFAAVSTSLKAFAWDTHMTLHNIQDQLIDVGPAELSTIGADSCTAQASSTCEAGTDYVLVYS